MCARFAGRLFVTAALLLSCRAADAVELPKWSDIDTESKAVSWYQWEVIWRPRSSMTHEWNGLATYAAWQQVRGRFDGEGINEADANWFVGFVEGRYRVEVPAWWKSTVANAEGRSFGGSYFSAQTQLELPRRDLGIQTAQEINLKVGEQVATLSVGEEQLRLPRQVVDAALAAGFGLISPRLATTVGKQQGVFAFYSGLDGDPFEVVCWDKAAGKPAWKADVWGSSLFFKSGGGSVHVVEIKSSDSRVYVFGATSHSVYLEEFDYASGENLSRFSSSLWRP